MKILDLNDVKTQEYLQKIGKIIVEVNHLESFIELLIWQVIAAKKSENGADEQNVGRRITVNLNFMQKSDLLRSLLVERMGEEFVKSFTEEIYKKLQTIAEKRDDIAHAKWFIQYGSSKEDLETEIINYFKAYKRGRSFDFDKAKRIVKISELDELSKLIDETVAFILHYGIDKIKF